MKANIIISKKKNVWHPQNYLKDIKVLYKTSVTMKELKEKLEETPPQYIDMRSFSADDKGKPINEFSNVYQLGILEGWENSDGEQLYVWETMTKDGNFRYTSYGTREKFGEVLAKKAINKTNITLNQD